MTKELRNDRWTCPNDRNLQLRSKLNAGWSCHTGKKAIQKDSQLTENELNEIQKVLQRSQNVERNERDRVMKLVERLDNMKKNASHSISSPNKCALCADYFCVLRSAPNKCAFCHRILCSKCCIDSQHFVDSDSSTSGSSRSSSITGSFLPNSKVLIWQCRLCSEQREFLKKSGAWFSKKSPSYINDEKYSSTSNVSGSDSRQTSLKNIISSSSNLRRNISSFSSNSLSFRFWNKKDESDNFSDISMDNDMQHDFNINTNNLNNINNNNIDSISLNNRTNSSENVASRSPKSPLINKKQSKFQYDYQNGINQQMKSNISPSTSPSPYHKSQDNFNFVPPTNGLNYHKSFFLKKSPVSEQMNELSNSSISTTISSSLSSRISPSFQKKTFDIGHDDEASMVNYNYYSNIITNLKTNEPTDVDDTKISSSSSSNLIKSLSSKKISKADLVNTQKASTESSKSDIVLKKQPKSVNSNSFGSSDTMKNNGLATNDYNKRITNSKKNLTGITSITNGILNNSLSASASSLEQVHKSPSQKINLQKPKHRKNGNKDSNVTQGSTDSDSSVVLKSAIDKSKLSRISMKLKGHNSKSSELVGDTSLLFGSVSGTSVMSVSSAAASLNKLGLNKP